MMRQHPHLLLHCPVAWGLWISILEWVGEKCNPYGKKLLLTRFKDIEGRRMLRCYISVQTFLIFWESGTRVMLGLGFVDSYLSLAFLWDRNIHLTSLWASVMGALGVLLCLIFGEIGELFLRVLFFKILFPIVMGWVDSLSSLCLYSIDHSNEISFQMFKKKKKEVAFRHSTLFTNLPLYFWMSIVKSDLLNNHAISKSESFKEWS